MIVIRQLISSRYFIGSDGSRLQHCSCTGVRRSAAKKTERDHSDVSGGEGWVVAGDCRCYGSLEKLHFANEAAVRGAGARTETTQDETTTNKRYMVKQFVLLALYSRSTSLAAVGSRSSSTHKTNHWGS